MPLTVSITTLLREAGLRLLETLIEGSKPYGDRAEYHFVGQYAAALHRDPDSISAALMAAQRDLRNHDPENAGWLDKFDELFSHGGKAVNDFAENLWRAYLLHIDSAGALLWEQYREMQRHAAIETGRQLPASWRSWLNFIQAFMGLFETHLFDANPGFEMLFMSDVAHTLADVALPGVEASERIHPPVTRLGDEFDDDAMLTAYLEWCEQITGQIDSHGYQHSRTAKLPLDDVFVPPRFIPMDTYTTPADFVRYQGTSFSKPPPEGLQTLPDIGDLDEEKSVAITEALERNPRLLLLGEAGAGKTIVLRHLAFGHARAAREDIMDRGVDSRGATQPERRIPIYVQLAYYIERRNPDEPLTDYILRTVVDELRGVISSSLLTGLLKAGQCLILLDGLDEVINDTQRGVLATSVADFADMWCEHGNRVVVSCRLQDYHATPLPESFTGYVLGPLDRGQMGIFLIRWFLALERVYRPFDGDDEAARRAQAQTIGLLREVTANHQLYALAQNPMILRMLITIQEAGLRLPSQRVLIYEHVADALIREWRLPQRANQEPRVLERETRALFGELANWLQDNRPTGTADERQLHDTLGGVWQAQHPDASPRDAQEAIASFLAETRHRDGALVEMEPRRYGFACRALQEYFASRHLVASSRTSAERIRTHLHDPRWDEVIMLAVGFIAQSSPADAADLVVRGILPGDRRGASPYEDVLKRDVLLAARLLGEEIDVGAEVTRRIVEELVSLWVNADRDGAGRFRLVADHVRHCLARLDGTSAGQYAFQCARRYLASENEMVCAYAIDALTFWPAQINETLIEIDLKTAPPMVKLAMAHALGHPQELSANGYRTLLALYRDSDPRVSKAAQNALGSAKFPPDEVFHTPTELFRDEAPDKRRAAARLIEGLGELPALIIGELLRLLSDPDGSVRETAAKVLSNTPNLSDNTLTSICLAISTTHEVHEDVQLAAIAALARPTALPQEVIDHLIMWTQSDNTAVRREATKALSVSQNKTDDVLRALERLASDPIEAVRRIAVEALARKGHDDQRIAHSLIHKADVAEESSHNVRIGLARALREVREPSAAIRDTIWVLLKDPHPMVREAILESISNMDNPGAEIVRHLSGLIRSSDRSPNEPVVHALTKLRHLPAEILTTMIVEILPMAQPPVAHAILDCVQAHMRTMADEVSYSLLDIMLGVPKSLKPRVIPVLGMGIHAAGGVLEVILQHIDDENVPLQRAAIESLSHARKLPKHVVGRLLGFLGHKNPDVRLSAAVTLAKLTRHLPDAALNPKQAKQLADTLYNLLRELPSRAAWEMGSEPQNEALYALNWVAYCMRPGWMQLSSGN